MYSSVKENTDDGRCWCNAPQMMYTQLPGLDGCDKCIMNVVTAYFKVRAVRTFAWNYWKESIEL
jgi:hypothetical protein